MVPGTATQVPPVAPGAASRSPDEVTVPTAAPRPMPSVAPHLETSGSSGAYFSFAFVAGKAKPTQSESQQHDDSTAAVTHDHD